MRDLTPEQWEMICGSGAVPDRKLRIPLERTISFGNWLPRKLRNTNSMFLKRKSELQLLAREIKERLPQ
jgi:hypothetical protein